MQIRYQSTGPSNQSGRAPNAKTDPKAKTNTGSTGSSSSKSSNPSLRWLFILGGAALGTSLIVPFFNDKRQPIESLESTLIPSQKKDLSLIFVLGGPGSGKGTQCANLVREYGFVHLSAGDLLREEQKRPGSEYGKLIQEYIKSGQIVPQEITVNLLRNAINKASKEEGKTKFLIDGFPRKMDQAITFEKEIGRAQVCLFFDCPERVMLERLLSRGETSGREDDNVESIKKRFKTFIDTSMPVVDYLHKDNRVLTVQCDSGSPTDVYQHVQAQLKTRNVLQ